MFSKIERKINDAKKEDVEPNKEIQELVNFKLQFLRIELKI